MRRLLVSLTAAAQAAWKREPVVISGTLAAAIVALLLRIGLKVDVSTVQTAVVAVIPFLLALAGRRRVTPTLRAPAPLLDEDERLETDLAELAGLEPLSAPPIPDRDESAKFRAQVRAVDQAHAKALASAVKRLTDAQKTAARKRAVRAAYVMLKNAGAVHYTEGSLRWSGITRHLRSYLGQFPPYSDCSASVTWQWWDALLRYLFPDVLNGEAWNAGFTGTLVSHGRSVGMNADNFPLGSLVIYGTSPSNTQHVAIYVGNGNVISHGGEGGPYLLRWDYRQVVSVRCYV